MKSTVSIAALLLYLAPASFAQLKSPAVAISQPSFGRQQTIGVHQLESDLIALAIAALKRLDEKVLIYRSLAEFEVNGKFAHVSFEDFKTDLHEVIAEVEPILAVLPETKLKRELANVLYSYRDGLFWWGKIDKPRVIHTAALSFAATSTPSDRAYSSTIPYTVVIHWRQANKYLKRSEALACDAKSASRGK